MEVQVKMSSREYNVVLDADTMMNKSSVLSQLSRQCPKAIFLASGVPTADWQFLIDQAMAPLLTEYGKNPTEKQPVKFIGLQAQLLPEKLSDLQESHIRYFFNHAEGVLDAQGEAVKDSDMVYDPNQMKGVTQIQYKASGESGFLKFLEPPLASGSGDSYFEFILTAVFPFCYGWASSFNVKYFKKLPTLILEGEPGEHDWILEN